MDRRFILKKFKMSQLGMTLQVDANVAEQVETPVVVETPPLP